jgi:hypothetical protein
MYTVTSVFEFGGMESDALPRETVQEVLDTVARDLTDGAVEVRVFQVEDI